METPGTSGGFKILCVTTNNLQETREKDKEPIVNIVDKDESRLLNIFPEEIWRKVLGNVDRGSLESVNNASPFFRRLLYPDRQLFLFAPVWEILGVQYEVDSDPVYSDLQLKDGALNNSSDDDELEKAKISVILKLRLVCRDWCLAINKFYEEHYHNNETRESVLRPRVESGLDSADEIAINRKYDWKKMGDWSEYKLWSVEKIQNFIEHFEATHDSQTNPFPFRKVTFHSLRNNMNYLSEVIPLVKKYGHHIWFCKLYFWGLSLNSRSESYLHFRELLSLMPNLKVLRLHLQKDYFHLPVHREVLANHPIPKLESLTFVSFNLTSRILMESLLDNNSQVTKVEILKLNDFDFATVPLPNLTHLAVCFESLREFAMFKNCGRLLRLEMLHVTFSYCEPVLFNHLTWIFACLEQWKDSLEDVAVDLPYADRDDDKAEIVQNLGIRLDLPHVKRLRLRINNIMSLDFILPMKDSLEILEFFLRWQNQDWQTIPRQLLDEMKTKEVIKIHSVDNFNMYNSNIWTLFAKLRRIHVETSGGSFRNGPAFIRQKLETSKGH